MRSQRENMLCFIANPFFPPCFQTLGFHTVRFLLNENACQVNGELLEMLDWMRLDEMDFHDQTGLHMRCEEIYRLSDSPMV